MASIGWPAAIRPMSGNTMPLLTDIACFSFPLGGNRVDRTAAVVVTRKQPFFLRFEMCLCTVAREFKFHTLRDFLERRRVTVLLHEVGDEVVHLPCRRVIAMPELWAK